MHVVLNALTVERGGGLTVMRGVLHGLRTIAPDLRITLLTSRREAHRQFVQMQCADEIHQISPGAPAPRLYLWQNVMMGRWLRRHGGDVLLSVNHFAKNVPLPQVVYHLNLLRFWNPDPPSSPVRRLADWVRDGAAHQALRCAAANVFESQHLRDVAERRVGCQAKNGSVIHIGLPERLLRRTQSDPAAAVESHRLVAITSPNPHKDNPTLIKTLANLARRDADTPWHLDIAGGTHLEQWNSMNDLARDLNVSDRITWHGFCDDAKLTRLLSGALCLVSTSRVESFAMVALEAMSHSCPPIVANCAAMPESVGEAGLLAIPGCPDSFANEVHKLRVNPALRAELADRGEQWIQKFRWTSCGREFLELFNSIFESSCGLEQKVSA